MFLCKTRKNNFDRDKKILEAVAFSNDFPMMWLIITDEYAFFQPYQYGNLEIKPIMGENFFVLQIKKGRFMIDLNHTSNVFGTPKLESIHSVLSNRLIR
jgi:hypothetical protein